jgi:hypothetical protein
MLIILLRRPKNKVHYLHGKKRERKRVERKGEKGVGSIRSQAPAGSGKIKVRTDNLRASRTIHVSVYPQWIYPYGIARRHRHHCNLDRPYAPGGPTSS